MLVVLVILAAAYAATILLDFRTRLKESPKGEKALYLIMLAISVVPLVLSTLEIPVPSPTMPIIDAVRAIFHIP